MSIVMSDVLALREAATARIKDRTDDPNSFAYHTGSANAARAVLYALAAGETVTENDLEHTLTTLTARLQQSLEHQHHWYYSGEIAMTTYLLQQWPTGKVDAETSCAQPALATHTPSRPLIRSASVATAENT
ncbi:hypothetical protein [Mycolicibacterium alvei]|uniref:Uncharacterized protein n=1 Tax=Mycolicibacterium alvei TaxID=67081 RepID=A0A6N4V471_9MYCO|nr:hypothetical protein [Mycolicibacterium alvei]MCV7003504.1 hypothetical protein [Mycolicibacterium alvei]BBX30542.1 hypothetical protein MALV_56670 [Mycolicibacterium alvei]